jgi:hypothetical protein
MAHPGRIDVKVPGLGVLEKRGRDGASGSACVMMALVLSGIRTLNNGQMPVMRR